MIKQRRRSADRKGSTGSSVKLTPGVILTDKTQTSWRIGPTIGAGSFGDIYLVSQSLGQVVANDARYVIKVEPITNGPLFVEMNFYLRVSHRDKIEKWQEKQNLQYLGMPHLVAFGSELVGNEKIRFLVIPRYGEDIASIFNQYGGKFSLKTAITIGLQIIDILEYIHYNGYIHADVKGSNIVLGYNKGEENKVYLVDFGLACSYVDRFGVHKEYGLDGRRAHEGTLEYTSRDAHIGAHSRRSDLETLGYNLMEWLSGKLPWTDVLRDPDEVAGLKTYYMENISLLMKKCFPYGGAPAVLEKYLKYVSSLEFSSKPDYNSIRTMLIAGLKAAGLPNDGKLHFGDVNQNKHKADSRSLARNRTDADSQILDIKRITLKLSKRRTRHSSAKDKSPGSFDWVKVIQSNPERDAKHKKAKETVCKAKPLVDDLDPSMMRTSDNIVANPTPPMLKIIIKWLLELIFLKNCCSIPQIKLLQQWYWSCRSKFLSSPPHPKEVRTKTISSFEKSSKNSLMEHYNFPSGVSAHVMVGEARKLYVKARIRGKEVIITCKNIESMFKLQTKNLQLNLDKKLFSAIQNGDDPSKDIGATFNQTEHHTSLPDRRVPIIDVTDLPPCRNPSSSVNTVSKNLTAASNLVERSNMPMLDDDEFMAKFKPAQSKRNRRSRSVSSDGWRRIERLRSTPARRQRSVTPADTFYTPYRGPSPLRFEEPVSNRSRSSRSRNRGSPSSHREYYTPSPPRRRGRPSKKDIERRAARIQEARAYSTKNGEPDRERSHNSSEPRYSSKLGKRDWSAGNKTSPPRKRGRPSKMELERRAVARDRARRSSSPRRRDRSQHRRSPSPRRRDRSEPRRSPTYERNGLYTPGRERRHQIPAHGRLSRRDTLARGSSDHSSPVIKRDKSPWTLRRRSVSRPIDYCCLSPRPSPSRVTRSRAKRNEREACGSGERTRLTDNNRDWGRESKRECRRQPEAHRRHTTYRRA